MPEILYREESYKIIGACFEVYNDKGFGFTEPIYHECLQIELALQGIPFVSQPTFELEYKGTLLEQFFKPDFVCYDKIVLEVKTVKDFTDAHRAQVLNYLHATKLDLGLLVNFGQHPRLAYERLVNERRRESRQDEWNPMFRTYKSHF